MSNHHQDFNYDINYFNSLEDHWSKVSFPSISRLLAKGLFTAESKLSISQTLDLGCGNGTYANILKEHSENIHGVDISKIAVENCSAKNIYSSVYKGNAVEGLPFRNDFFDVVFSTEVIEHIEDLDLLFMELQRIIKRKGFLILTTTMYFNSINCYNRKKFSHSYFDMLKVVGNYMAGFFNKSKQQKFILTYCFEELGGHHHGFHKRQLLKILRKHEFELVTYNYFYPIEPFRYPFNYTDFKSLLRKKFPKNLFAPIAFIVIPILNKTFKFLGLGANNIFIIAQRKGT